MNKGGDTELQASLGFYLCTPYKSENTFSPDKESAGDLQRSVICSVGGGYIDDHGNDRKPIYKKGDVILHKYTSHTGMVDSQEIRAVHFFDVVGQIK